MPSLPLKGASVAGQALPSPYLILGVPRSHLGILQDQQPNRGIGFSQANREMQLAATPPAISPDPLNVLATCPGPQDLEHGGQCLEGKAQAQGQLGLPTAPCSSTHYLRSAAGFGHLPRR